MQNLFVGATVKVTTTHGAFEGQIAQVDENTVWLVPETEVMHDVNHNAPVGLEGCVGVDKDMVTDFV